MTVSACPSVEHLVDVARAFPGSHDGHKEMHIRTQLGITPTRFYQLLDRAIDTTIALEHDPQTTHRLRRQREAAIAARAARG